MCILSLSDTLTQTHLYRHSCRVFGRWRSSSNAELSSVRRWAERGKTSLSLTRLLLQNLRYKTLHLLLFNYTSLSYSTPISNENEDIWAPVSFLPLNETVSITHTHTKSCSSSTNVLQTLMSFHYTAGVSQRNVKTSKNGGDHVHTPAPWSKLTPD